MATVADRILPPDNKKKDRSAARGPAAKGRQPPAARFTARQLRSHRNDTAVRLYVEPAAPREPWEGVGSAPATRRSRPSIVRSSRRRVAILRPVGRHVKPRSGSV